MIALPIREYFGRFNFSFVYSIGERICWTFATSVDIYYACLMRYFVYRIDCGRLGDPERTTDPLALRRSLHK